MEYKTTETLPYPIDKCWAAMRDGLPDIAAAQKDLEYVKVSKRRREASGSLHVLSRWKADPPLPAFLKGFIKPEMLLWTDDAHWHDNRHTCEFVIHPDYDTEDIRCSGSIVFEPGPRGKGTRITYSGSFSMNRTERSSILMTGLVLRGIETLACQIITRNFAAVAKTLDETLAVKKA